MNNITTPALARLPMNSFHWNCTHLGDGVYLAYDSKKDAFSFENLNILQRIARFVLGIFGSFSPYASTHRDTIGHKLITDWNHSYFKDNYAPDNVAQAAKILTLNIVRSCHFYPNAFQKSVGNAPLSLPNAGNTCYIASALQMITNDPLLFNELMGQETAAIFENRSKRDLFEYLNSLDEQTLSSLSMQNLKQLAVQYAQPIDGIHYINTTADFTKIFGPNSLKDAGFDEAFFQNIQDSNELYDINPALFSDFEKKQSDKIDDSILRKNFLRSLACDCLRRRDNAPLLKFIADKIYVENIQQLARKKFIMERIKKIVLAYRQGSPVPMGELARQLSLLDPMFVLYRQQDSTEVIKHLFSGGNNSPLKVPFITQIIGKARTDGQERIIDTRTTEQMPLFAIHMKAGQKNDLRQLIETSVFNPPEEPIEHRDYSTKREVCSFSSAPERLFVALKRFTAQNTKINDPVHVGNGRLRLCNADYEISSFILQSGSTGYGHYVSYVKKITDEGFPVFWKCDDGRISLVSCGTFLTEAENAYLLNLRRL